MADKDEFESAFDEFSKNSSAQNEPTDRDELEDELDEALNDPPENQQQEAEQEQEPEQPDELETLKRERDDWRHKFQSDQGRIAALQRRVAELQDTRSPAQPTQQQIASAMQDEGEWKEFSETYPQIASALEKRFAAERQRSDEGLRNAVAPIVEAQQDQSEIERSRYVEWQYDLLAKEHPDYLEVAKTKEFAEWRDRQRPAIQSLFDSQDYRDASEAIRLYKMERGASQAASQISDIRQQRERRLTTSAAPQGRSSSSVRNEIPADDFEAAFAAFAARKERQNRNARY